MQSRILGSLKSAVKINKSIGWGNITLKKHHSYSKKSEAEETLWTEEFKKVSCSRWHVSPAWVVEGPGVSGGRGGCLTPPIALLHMRRDFSASGGLLTLTTSPQHLTPATRLAATAGGPRMSALECPLCGDPRMCPQSGHPEEPEGGAFPLAPLRQPALRRKPQDLGGDELTTRACHWWDVQKCPHVQLV